MSATESKVKNCTKNQQKSVKPAEAAVSKRLDAAPIEYVLVTAL